MKTAIAGIVARNVRTIFMVTLASGDRGALRGARAIEVKGDRLSNAAPQPRHI